MKVIATKLGFYNGSRVREGQVFDVPDGAKSKWFEPYGNGEAAAPKPKRGKSAPETFSEIAKQDGEDLGAGLV